MTFRHTVRSTVIGNNINRLQALCSSQHLTTHTSHDNTSNTHERIRKRMSQAYGVQWDTNAQHLELCGQLEPIAYHRNTTQSSVSSVCTAQR